MSHDPASRESDALPRRADRPLRVAFQGEPGAYSEEAVQAAFGPDAEPVPRRSFEEVARAVLSGETDRGMLPVENSLAGTVVGSYDVLAAGGLEVVGEVVRPIRHCLLGVDGATIEKLRRVLSHPVALAQCTEFFRRHPSVEGVAVYDTAGAAKSVARDRNPAEAAIAGRVAAERYGLSVLATDLQDRDDNQTRFYIVRKREESVGSGAARKGGERALPAPGPTGPAEGTGEVEGGWKTALLFRTKNEPGALVRVLQAFSSRGVNLSKLESRPGEDPWTYRFFLELEDRGDRGAALEALREASEFARELKVLGIFRRWPPLATSAAKTDR